MANTLTVDSKGAFLRLPYAERRLIQVLKDSEFEAAERKVQSEEPRGETSTKMNLVKRGFGHVKSAPSSLVHGAAGHMAHAYHRVRHDGLDRLRVSQRTAEVLRFPVGHPLNHVLYVGNPAAREMYYPTATFHRLTFEHKFAELVHLLMSLGASHIRVEHVHGWSKEFSSKLVTVLNGSATHSHVGQAEALFEATLNGSAEPSVPHGLNWYPHEALWQGIADGRINQGLREFDLDLLYQDSFDIDAELVKKISKAGLKLGGTYEEYEWTKWHVSGTFKRATRKGGSQ